MDLILLRLRRVWFLGHVVIMRGGSLFKLLVCLAVVFTALSSGVVLDRETLYFSSPQNQVSEAEKVAVFNHAVDKSLAARARIVGKNADAFRLLGKGKIALEAEGTLILNVVFSPLRDQIGPLTGRCEILGAEGEVLGSVELRGLAAPGLEGKGEAPLAQVVETLDLGIDIGWTTLGNHTRPEMIGDEVEAGAFRKAGPGLVTILPVARYSPDFLLPFGYYDASESEPKLHAIGTLAQATETRFEQNCLFPNLASGVVQCDPQVERFGVFTASPSHVAYTQDSVNSRLQPSHVSHAVRVYPINRFDGIDCVNTFLICFEEAKNGDYQDYVFVISNVVPAN